MSVVDEFLEHHGVKGQRWGVRRRSSGSTKGYSKDAKTATVIRKKAKSSPVKVKALSNSEIEVFVKRVRLESQFHEATPGPARRAIKMVQSILGTGKTVNDAVSFANSPSGKHIKNSLKKKKSTPEE